MSTRAVQKWVSDSCEVFYTWLQLEFQTLEEQKTALDHIITTSIALRDTLEDAT